jgi:hypothetical protein
VSKSQDRPKRQKRRPAEFREKPEPREAPEPKPAGPTEEEIAVLVMMKGPDWRQKP